MPDDRGDGVSERWMTYREAGEAFGLSPEAVRKRARRLGLRMALHNDGKVRVLFPEGVVLHPAAGPGDDRETEGVTSDPDGRVDELRRQISGLEADMKREREARTAAEVRAGVAEAMTAREVEARKDAEARAEREAEGRREAADQAAQERARAATAEAEAAEARTQAQAAQGRLDALLSAPWWRRLIGKA